MALVALITGSSDETLWGLSSVDRITRQLAGVGINKLITAPEQAASGATVLLVNARYLFELRTFQALLRHPGSSLVCPTDGQVAATYGDSGAVRSALLAMQSTTTHDDSDNVLRPADLEGYSEHLRKVEPPLLEPISADNHLELESRLYGNAYKGITDLVTKWWWPRPARVLVRLCAQQHISPNAVTIFGLGLVIASTVLFAHGFYLLGLLSGWVMTLLDTVDGKLARVTVQSSRIGHVLDHGMDIIHPPIWYVYWGLGLAPMSDLLGFDLESVLMAIVGGYVAGRGLEALFHALGHCSMFSWRPFDAYFRLVTARRNPCLIILTTTTIVGRPDIGLLGVALWTLASSALMAARLIYAAAIRAHSGPLESWLKDPETAAIQYPRAFRTFSATRGAYA
jgi:phosphatidylglycerophosphate synthase